MPPSFGARRVTHRRRHCRDGYGGSYSSESKKPAILSNRRFFEMIPAITYFRTGRHYHRPRELNCRVRNGNECDLPGKVTGKSQRRSPAEAGRTPLRKTTKGRARVYRYTSKKLLRHDALTLNNLAA